MRKTLAALAALLALLSLIAALAGVQWAWLALAFAVVVFGITERDLPLPMGTRKRKDKYYS